MHQVASSGEPIEQAPGHVAAPGVDAVDFGNRIGEIPQCLGIKHQRAGPAIHRLLQANGRIVGGGLDERPKHLCAHEYFRDSRRNLRQHLLGRHPSPAWLIPERPLQVARAPARQVVVIVRILRPGELIFVSAIRVRISRPQRRQLVQVVIEVHQLCAHAAQNGQWRITGNFTQHDALAGPLQFLYRRRVVHVLNADCTVFSVDQTFQSHVIVQNPHHGVGSRLRFPIQVLLQHGATQGYGLALGQQLLCRIDDSVDRIAPLVLQGLQFDVQALPDHAVDHIPEPIARMPVMTAVLQ